tara:strand:- start:1014 stop:1268 length:255 start_codon:yes stop_codon:yes gene_type:complete
MIQSYKMVYWSESKQRIRYTANHTFEDFENYEYIGTLTKVEFDLLIEALFLKFQDEEISFEDVQIMYDRLRKFCNELKNITENL